MKPNKTTLAVALAVVLLTLFSSGAAYAGGYGHHGSGVRFGVVIGGPGWFGPGYYPPYYSPYYYPPYASAYYPSMPASPPVYIEQGGAQPAPGAAPQASYWYFCAEANGYYPYVKECPGGWQRVSPQAPPG